MPIDRNGDSFQKWPALVVLERNRVDVACDLIRCWLGDEKLAGLAETVRGILTNEGGTEQKALPGTEAPRVPEQVPLLPCPFCGQQPTFYAKAPTPTIECNTLGCNALGPDGEENSAAAVLGAWNTRPIEARCLALADRLDAGGNYSIAAWLREAIRG